MTFPTQDHITAAQTAADRVKAKTSFYCWPSVTLAQACIESANWTKLSGHNNGFGIKANAAQIAAGQYTTCTTHEFINGRTVTIQDKFANFASLADAYEAHAMLFVRVGVYAEAVKEKTAAGFLTKMAKHYATAPDYERVILGVMTRLNLQQYDKPQSAPEKPVQAEVAPPAAPVAPVTPLPPVAVSVPTFWQRVAAWFKRAV